MPRIGMRNLKTAIAVAICILALHLVGINQPFFACMTAVFTMQANVSTSFRAGLDRFLGTLAGAVIGTLLALLSTLLPMESLLLRVTVAPAGVIFIIYVLNRLKLRGSIFIASIVFFDLLMRVDPSAVPHYAVSRTALTGFGAIVALLVNRYIYPPKQEGEEKPVGNLALNE
ncbi:MAG TPA: hypothetical protein GX528_07710 [Firmicutes bacterium]|nr:hypothetical protein [Bacillota bacterium]